MKIFFSKKVNFLTRCHEKLKKVAIFSKKREKREKAIFFFKNGQIDPKIGKIEVLQQIKLPYQAIFEILSFSDFMTQNGGHFSEKWDFWPFFGTKREISQRLLKIKENPFLQNLQNVF